MDLDVATAAYGFAVPSGTFLDTGIAGLTLSGGISYLVASEGFACDALICAELVTPDGSIIEVDTEREPDLLWALRGGGGNFGVVTRLRYRMTAVERMYGGVLRYQGDGVRDVLERMFDLDRSAPDELALQAVATRSADTGDPALAVIVAWRGEPGSGEAVIRTLIDHPARYETDLHAMSCLQLQAQNTPMPFGLRNYWKGHFVRQATPGLAGAIVGAAAGSSGNDMVLLELIHGAAHRSRSSRRRSGADRQRRTSPRWRSGRILPRTRTGSAGPGPPPRCSSRSRCPAAATSTMARSTSRRPASRRPSASRRSTACASSSAATTPPTASASTQTSRRPDQRSSDGPSSIPSSAAGARRAGRHWRPARLPGDDERAGSSDRRRRRSGGWPA